MEVHGVLFQIQNFKQVVWNFKVSNFSSDQLHQDDLKATLTISFTLSFLYSPSKLTQMAKEKCSKLNEL